MTRTLTLDIPKSWWHTLNTGQNHELVAEFTIPGEPVSKSRARFTKRGSKTVTYTPENVKVAETKVAWAFRAAAPHAQVAESGQEFGVVAIFMNGTRQRRDVDNMVKLVLDGLNGVAWHDDNQVTEITARKSYVTPKTEARTQVAIYRIGPETHPTRPCLRCGTDFRTYSSWESNPNGKKYCSTTCAYAHRVERRERKCENCDATFLAHGAKASTRYCSRKCSSEAGRVQIPCRACGSQFAQYKSWAERRPYCSPECSAEGARIARNKRRSKTFPGKCSICGSGTTRKEYRRCNPCKLAGKVAPDAD